LRHARKGDLLGVGFLGKRFLGGFLGGPDKGHQLFAGDGFLGQQELGDLVQQGAVFGEDGGRLVVAALQQLFDIPDDDSRGILGTIQLGLTV